MSLKILTASSVSALLLLQGCASTPLGPTVSVLPNPKKPFEQFQADDAVCKNFAASQVAGQADQANAVGVGGAVLGTVLGAGLGAAIGGGEGAGIGAAGGALGGSALGAGATGNAQYGIQQQYNNAYIQCQYAKGNQIAQPPPVAAYPAPVYPGAVYPAPVYPAPAYYPPPPAYYPPPGY